MIPDVLRFWGSSPSSSAGLIWIVYIFFPTYLLGSIPSGILITKTLGLGNLKKLGSGNIGATNVLRTGNKMAAIATLLLDMSKGIIAVIVTEQYLGITASHFAALGVFCGHLFSVFLFFKGGKGVATFLGILLVLDFFLCTLVCISWLIIAWWSKYSSVASLISSALSVIIVIILEDLSFMWLILVMVLLIWLRHTGNIANLFTGRESKIKL